MSIKLMVGDASVLALEAEIEQPVDRRWWFGRFRMIVRQQAIGDWNDIVALRAVVSWWASFVQESYDRWDTNLRADDPRLSFDLLIEWTHGTTDTGSIEAPTNSVERFTVNQLGMSAFDPYVIFLLEPPGQGQWLLWKFERPGQEVQGELLPAGTLQRVGRLFVSAMAPYLGPQRPGFGV